MDQDQNHTTVADGAVAAISVRNVLKVYGATTALANADFEVLPGEIHGLLGENGAGKSTLVRILAGVEDADGGEVLLYGQSANGGVAQRTAEGYMFIHQDLGLFTELSVADNVALGTGFERRFGLLSARATTARVAELMKDLGIDLDPASILGELPVADQTAVAITRALGQGARLIVLDEPTAYLEARQVRSLFALLAKLREQGVACVLISHRTEDILGVCDRITVLRDGRTVAVRRTEGLAERELIRLITGHEPQDAGFSRESRSRQTVFHVADLVGEGFGPVSLELGGGEVVGICGLADAGHYAFGEALFGTRVASAGEMNLHGRLYRPRRAEDAIAAGVAFVPPERATDGLAGELSVRENLFMRPDAGAFGRLAGKSERSAAQKLLKRFDVRPPESEYPINTFSGGNQQKALVAKWLRTSPGIAVMNDPTAGVDVGAKAEIHRQLRQLCDDNEAGVLVITCDFREIAETCDRAIVMRHGRVVGTTEGSEMNANLLTELAYGGEV